MSAAPWDAVARAMRERNGSECDLFSEVVVENEKLNRLRYDQEEAMGEMREELESLRCEAAEVLGRRDLVEEAGRLEKRVAELQEELVCSNAAERSLQEERVALADALHDTSGALERCAGALDGSRAGEAWLRARLAQSEADVGTLKREVEAREAMVARSEEERARLGARK